MLRKIKNSLRRRRLDRSGFGRTADVRVETFGYGVSDAWGVAADYVPENALVWSVGVGRDVIFDLQIIERFGCEVHAFDPTPKSMAWVAEQDFPASFHFHPVGMANYDGDLRFYPPRKERSAHFTPIQRYTDQTGEDCVVAPVKRISTLMNELGHSRIDLLKIDIDGGEYDVLGDLVASDIRPPQLLLEFHHMFKTIDYSQTEAACRSLLDVGYQVFHVSPRSYEMCFIHESALSTDKRSKAA